MATGYTHTKSVLDAVAFLEYICKTLPTAVSVANGDGVTVTITFSAALSAAQQSTLTSLVAAYADPVVGAFDQMSLSLYNNCSSPLAGGEVYTGLWEDVSRYASVVVSAISNVASATTGMQIQFGLTSAQSDVSRAYTLAAGAGTSVTLAVPGRWVRVLYTNGPVAQASFALQLRSSVAQVTTAVDGQTAVTDDTESQLTRNLNMGRLDIGTYVPVRMDEDRRMRVRTAADSSLAAFSASSPLVQASFQYGIDEREVAIAAAAAGSVTAGEGRASVSSGAAEDSSASLTTTRYAATGVGRTARALVSVAFGAGTPGSTQICGVGTQQEGLFVGYTGAVFGVAVRCGGQDTWISSTTFAVDRIDGTGPSGIVLDPTVGNVFQIAYDCTGYGSASFALCPSAASSVPEAVVMHRLSFGGAAGLPSPQLDSLPMMASCSNAANASAVVITVASMAAYSDGVSLGRSGALQSAETSRTVAAGQFVPLLTLSPSSTFRSVTNFRSLALRSLHVAADGSRGNVIVALFEGAELTGASFADVDAAASCAQADSSAAAVSGGTMRYCSAVASSGDRYLDLADQDIRLSPGMSMTVACKLTSAAAASTVTACLVWCE
ncbi:hypothetical protein JKP88DRAFT_273081 [Tribonema minus]|uniref:Uncharacterized protein n=1 Tax=Tribonema minus TaxID=303371 RepID=A0A835YX76_9STRA|nr:hypothetical protein JKP88DRAFT_273081 [Tribonema minus]